MKNLARILNSVTSVLLVIIGVAFAFIEGLLLLTGDFLLFESEFLAFLQMFLRFLLAAGAAALGILAIVKKERSFLTESLVALACTFIMSPFLTNGFGLYFIILAILFVLTNIFYSRFMNK